MTHSRIKKTAKKKTLRQRTRIFLRRHVFNKRAAEGSVTIFLIIIMLPMLIFSCSVVDLCKIFMAKNATQSALELAMNSRLTSYDDVLKDMYGILASSADESKLAENLTQYYKLTLESTTGAKMTEDETKYVNNFFADLFGTNMSALENEISGTNGFLNLFENPVSGDTVSFKVTPIVTSSASNPDVLQRQIVDYMKYRGPLYMASGIMDKITSFADVSNQANAAKSQINYEKTLEDAGKAFEQAYKNVKDLIEDSKKFEEAFSFGSFYTGGTFVMYKDILELLLWSASCAYVCSPMGDKGFNSSGELTYVTKAKNVFDSDYSVGTSRSVEDLKNKMDEIGDTALEYAKVAKDVFGSGLSGAAFMLEANSNSKSVDSLEYFLCLFEKSVKGNDEVLDLLDSYNKACGYLQDQNRKLDKESQKATPNETYIHNYEREIEKADPIVADAEIVIKEIEEAARAIKSHMEYEYRNARNWYNQAINGTNGENGLKEMFKKTKDQIDRLDALLNESKTKDGSIAKVQDKLKKAQEEASNFKTAVDGVQSESEKAALTENYNSDAANVANLKLNGEDINKLKSILEDLEKDYKAVDQLIKSIRFLGESMVDGKKINEDLTDQLKSFLKGKSKLEKSWYSYGIGEASLYSSTIVSNVTNIGKWDSKNSDIKDNAFYKVLEKYGKEKEKASKEADNKAKEEKKQITDLGKNAGSENSKNKSNDEVSDPKKNDATEELKYAWFIPKEYPTFEKYAADLEKAFIDNRKDNGNDSKLSILTEKSFSFEPTGPEKNLTDMDSDFGGDSTNKVSTGAINMLDSIGTFFEKLLYATRDNFYIAEYLTENFPCFTTEIDKDQMITGTKFYDSDKKKYNVVCGHSSLEYILYGIKDGGIESAALSVAAAGAVVFGVRFALNLIYALTSPTLASQVDPIAMASAFAAPLVRTVILIGLALGESAIDLTMLLAGEDVALFKTDASWICSPSGALKTAAAKVGVAVGELAIKKAPELIEAGSELLIYEINRAVDFAVEELASPLGELTEKTVNDLAGKLIEQTKSEIKSDICDPIYRVVSDSVNLYDLEEGNVPVSDIETRLTQTIKNLKDYLKTESASSDDMVRTIEQKVLDQIDVKALAREIHSKLGTLNDQSKNVDIEGFSKTVDGILDTVGAIINRLVTDVNDQLLIKCKYCINEAADKVKDTARINTKRAAEEFSTQLSSQISQKIRGKSENETKGANFQDPKGNSAEGEKQSGFIENKTDDVNKRDKMLKVSYKDYLYIFTVIGLFANKSNMLERAGQLITANVELKVKGKTRGDDSGIDKQNAYSFTPPAFDLNHAYTLFKGEAGSKTRTMFFGTTWDKQNQKWVAPASNEFAYTATTYVGY